MEFSSETTESRKVAEARNVSGVSLHGGPERPLCEAVKVKSRLLSRPQMPDPLDTYQRKLLTGSGPAQEKKVCCSQQS